MTQNFVYIFQNVEVYREKTIQLDVQIFSTHIVFPGFEEKYDELYNYSFGNHIGTFPLFG